MHAGTFGTFVCMSVFVLVHKHVYFYMMLCNLNLLLVFRKYNQEIADLILNDAIIECKLWEESATIICCINSGQMLYPCIKKAILCLGRVGIVFISLLYALDLFIDVLLNFFSCLYVLHFHLLIFCYRK